MPHKLSKAQEEAIKFIDKSHYSIIDMPPGQGKTLIPIEFAKRNKLNLLVFCPSYLRQVWVRELQNQWSECDIECYKGFGEMYPRWDDGASIVSQSQLTPRNAIKEKLEVIDSLVEWADVIAWDESQLLKNMDAKTTQNFHKLIYENHPKYLILLSGTPIKNRVDELYSQITLCQYKHDKEPQFLKDYPTWLDFAETFSNKSMKTVRVGRRSFLQIKFEGTKNLDRLKPYMDPCYYKLPKKYLHKLPEKTFYDIQAEGRYGTTKLKTLFDEFIKFSEENKGVSPTIKAKAALVTASFTATLAKDLEQKHGSVVIFTDHVESAKAIHRAIMSVSAKDNLAGVIHGELGIETRETMIEAFKKGIVKILVATVGTLSTGVDLTLSNCMIINDPPWTPGDLRQTEDRINRRNQTKPCFYYRVMATEQSKKIYDVLSKKTETINKIGELMEEGNE